MPLVIFLVVFQTFSTRVFAVDPSITITYLSPYGSLDGKVQGLVSGVNFPNYYVAAYIQVDEVWWTKPYLANPKCAINASTGKFSCAITTGGCDLYATSVFLQLLPKTQNPIICFPCQAKPQNPNALVSLTKHRPYPKTLDFSGYQWRVKKAPDCKLGPGPNYFSDLPSDVWVDNKGLHLRLRKDASKPKWYSTEVVLQQSLGYGTYIFLTNSRVDILDANAVLGLFTWDSKIYHPTHREIDVEFARWGNRNEYTNAQFVVQPASQCPGSPNCSRFRVNLTDANKYVTTYMTWKPGLVEFRSYKGKYLNNPPESALIHKWSKTEAPKKGKENIRFNFWLFNGTAPFNGKNSETIIEKFIFRPITTPAEEEVIED